MEILTTGESSHTDIAMCYMEGRADKKLIEMIKKRIQNVRVDALSMNQESLAECIFPGKWFNPFPKFKFSERPDTSAASILEGNIVILVDNSPSAMILPSSVFDIIEEADDYYFPPVTGTYLRLSRMLISLLSMLLTPTWLMLMQNTELIPHWLRFIRLSHLLHKIRCSQHQFRILYTYFSFWQFFILRSRDQFVKLHSNLSVQPFVHQNTVDSHWKQPGKK